MRYFILFLFLTAFGFINAYSQLNAFRLNLKDGAEQIIFLNDDPILKIEGSELKISTGKTNYTYPLSDVKNYQFVTDESGINDAVSDQTDFTRDGDIIIVGRQGASVDYSIVTVSGIIMTSGKGERSTIDISDYPTGIYLLTVNGSTTKIEKQ